MKRSEMNVNQQKVFDQVYHAANWVVGGYENRESDTGEPMPSRENLFTEIYYQVLNCTSFEGGLSAHPIKEIRFVGTEFIKERIENRLTKIGY